MKKFNVGLQLYSVKNAMKEDFYGTLKAVRDMGYEYVEFAGYYDKSAEEIKAILDELTEAPKTIAVIVGCEGGFSPDEAKAAESAGFKMANLGPRILRCETAPDYALSAISYKFEL